MSTTAAKDPILAVLEGGSALSRAWAQTDHEELAGALRAMPTKLRNRVLSAHRTPSSKVTATTARLLTTNLGRESSHDRLRAADVICSPFIRQLGDAIGDAVPGPALLGEVGRALHAMADRFGRSIVVLGTVAGTTAEPARFAPALVAAADEGLLSDELARAAGDIRSFVEVRLAQEVEGLADEDEEWGGSEEHDLLRERWAEAIEAAERIGEEVRAGRRPSDDDIDAVGHYVMSLEGAAERLGTEAQVDAVTAATEAIEARQAAFALSQRLRALVGPETLAAEIAELHGAVGAAEDDRELARRLERFLELLDTDKPLERFGLASALRSQPSPPAPVLLDAALAGLLVLDPLRGTLRGIGAEPATETTTLQGWESSADVAPPGTAPSIGEEPEPDGAPLDSASPVVPAAAAFAGQGPVVPEPSDAGSDLADPAAPMTGSSGADAGDAPGGADVASASAERDAQAAADDEVLAAEEATASKRTAPRAIVEEDAAERRGCGPAPAVAARATIERLTVAAPRKAKEVHDQADLVEEPSDEEAAATLTELVTARRFGLAHHLAAALAQDYRAEILAEAALAQAVRSPSSRTATETVTRVATTPLKPSDVGSVVLRAATITRVALLDPSSSAPALLRQMIAALGELPALRDFAAAVASATEKNLAVPAGGVAVDAAEAHAQAEAIASWADATLRRPPRQNRLYRGVEIWKEWMAPGGLLGSILSAVASNDAGRVTEVRAACAPLADRRLRGEVVESTDKAVREGRVGGAERIIGPAKKHLLRGVEEVVEQALLWCDSYEARGGDASELRDELAARAVRLRHPIADELAAVGSDEWSCAAAAAAGGILSETIGLLCNEGLAGAALAPVEALNGGLALVDGLGLDADLQPLGVPTATQLVRAARTSRADAFARRLAAGDFTAADVVIDLSTGPGDGFDETAARQELRSRERDERARMESSWRALDARFASARSRGRISDDDASRLHGMLLQAQPRSSDTDYRRDLGRVGEELDTLARDLDEAMARRRAAVKADVADAMDSDEVSQAWTVKLTDLLNRDELGAAEEYLHRARAGEAAPEGTETSGSPDGTLARLLAERSEGVTAEVVEAARNGTAVDGLDFSALAEIARDPVATALVAWRKLSGGERPADVEAALEPVLRLLGLIPTSVERPQALRAISTKGRWFVDVHGDRSGYAYVPDFGTRAAGRRRFMLCWDDLPMSQLWDLAAANAPPDQPVYVLRMGLVPEQARVELVRHARRRDDDVVVIDDAVILRCALVGRQSFDITMRTVLPYAAPNPYDPDLLAGTPEEMFYGRRPERQKIAAPAGSSFISGGRRLGKTALLRSVQSELEGTDVLALLIVMQHVAAVPPSDPAELWPLLAARLIEAGVLPPGTDGNADAVSGGVRAWLGDNPGRRLLLLLDECDFFLRADAGSSFANVVRLRDLMLDGDGRFKVVFSGLQHVARYRKLPNQPLSHLPQPLVIGPLDPASAGALVRRPLHALGWHISDAQVDRLVTFCACNPSVIQLACGQLLERLRSERIDVLAPWPVPDEVLNELLRSPEVERGVRNRLFLTLELDHRYKLLAYLLAWRAVSEGLGASVSPAEMRRQAVDYWPEGFAGQNPDDVRALCDELVGLGVFAGDAETGYRMLSPATVRLFGSVEEITDELISASGSYEPNVTAGAAGNRLSLGEGRFSPLTAAQLADVLGAGVTQLRVVVGSRALRAEAVPEALAAAAQRLTGITIKELTATSRRLWRDSMTAPAEGHVVVVSDMTVGRSVDSWEQSIDAARRRGQTRTARGTRSAVLVAGPSERWLLRQVVTTADGRQGPLADVAVNLRRVDMPSLRAWDRIEELDLAHPARQQRLLAVTGGWPMLVERVITRMRQRPFDEAADELEAHLATSEGAHELMGAVGLDAADADQPADGGLVACFYRLAVLDLHDTPADLAELLGIDDELHGEEDPAEAVAILRLLEMLVEDEDGLVAAEPVLAACARRVIATSVPA